MRSQRAGRKALPTRLVTGRGAQVAPLQSPILRASSRKCSTRGEQGQQTSKRQKRLTQEVVPLLGAGQFVVYDLEKLRGRYEAAGFACQWLDERPSRLRVYVTDQDNTTWEFIQYLSDDPSVQNDNSV